MEGFNMIPYANALRVTVAATPECIPLPAPIRGILTRLIVKQIDGTLAGYSFNVFTREGACTSVTDLAAVPLDGAVYKLMATQTVAGSSSTSEQFEKVFPYVNQDDQDPTSRRPLQRLYLELTGGVGKTFDISYAITQPALP